MSKEKVLIIVLCCYRLPSVPIRLLQHDHHHPLTTIQNVYAKQDYKETKLRPPLQYEKHEATS